MKTYPKQESTRDLLITRPNKPLPNVLDPRRPQCLPVDPKLNRNGQSPETTPKSIDYIA